MIITTSFPALELIPGLRRRTVPLIRWTIGGASPFFLTMGITPTILVFIVLPSKVCRLILMASPGLGRLIRIWWAMVSTLIFWEPFPNPAVLIILKSRALIMPLIHGSNEPALKPQPTPLWFATPTQNPPMTATVRPLGG